MFKKIIWLWFSETWKNKKSVKDYINSLVESGAWEFFTGYNPPYWYEKYGFEVSPNGRFAEHEQITSRETLEKICREVQSHGLELFVNLNAWYYTDETFPLIEKMFQEFEEIWVDGIICGNIWILEYLKKVWYTGKINISTILAVYNTQAIQFFLENYTINKIILSREVTLKEIEKLVNTFPDTRFEVFWEWDFCRYNNGLCYAEHKYGAKDICTLVVNDLVYKKRYNPDFKTDILNPELSNEEKILKMNDQYDDLFQQIADLSSPLYDLTGEEDIDKQLHTCLSRLYKRVDIYFDAMKPLTDEKNRNIIMVLKAAKSLLENASFLSDDQKNALKQFHDELEGSVKSWIQELTWSTKKIWGLPKLRAQELAKFYAKWDNLNLYSYLFFSKFQNIDTVKFPTRGRDYARKIELIEKVLKEEKIDPALLGRDMSIERTHYDLTYLFWEKLWFRNILKDFSWKK